MFSKSVRGEVIVFLTVLALFSCAVSPLPASGQTVTIDEGTRYQTIEGWGTCTGGSLSYDADWRYAYKYLGCNLLRFPMGKEVLIAPDGNYATAVELVDDINSNVGAMDFNTQAVGGDTALWLMDNALEPERVKIVGSVWSPPHWMKGPTGAEQYHVTNPSVLKPTPWLSEGTWGDSIGGRLLQDAGNLEQFGRYIAAWAKGFENHYGMPVYAVSLQNELSFENPFDSCTYLHGYGEPDPIGGQYWQYAGALKAVKDEFAQMETEHGAGFMATQIMGPHMASINTSPSSPWALNDQMQFIQAVKDHADAGLTDFLHIYTNNYSAPAYSRAKMWRAYWEGKDSMPGEPWAGWLYASGISSDGKKSWNSEAGGHGTNWNGCLDLAQDLHDQLVWGNVSAYIYWQFANSGVETSQHDLVAAPDLARPTKSKKYCAAKHFFRAIRPGAERVSATFAGGNSSYGYGSDPMRTDLSLNVSAYVHDEDETVTIVLVNMRANNYSVTINVPPLFGITVYSVHRSSASENFKQLSDLAVSGGQVSVTVPGESVMTLHGPPLIDLEADFNHDDVVDINDLNTMAADWMMTDRFEGAKDPGTENLVVCWDMNDPNDGTTVSDSSGNEHTGVFGSGSYDPSWYNDGQRGWCLYFDGTDYVDCGGGKDAGQPYTWADFNESSFTLAGWVKQEATLGWANFVSKGEIHWKLQMLLGLNYSHFAFPRAPGAGVGGTKLFTNNKWYHVAGVWDDEQEVARLYRDGFLDGVLYWGDAHPDRSGIFVDNDCNVLLGATVSEDYEELPERHKIGGCPIRDGANYAELFFRGWLSDVRLYDRALIKDEIKYLAGGEAVYYELESPANVWDEEPAGLKAVNFKDYAILANEWRRALN